MRYVLTFCGLLTAMGIGGWAIAQSPEPELVPPSMSEKPAPLPSPIPATSPPKWPAVQSYLYLSLYPLDFFLNDDEVLKVPRDRRRCPGYLTPGSCLYVFEPCLRFIVAEVHPEDIAIWVDPVGPGAPALAFDGFIRRFGIVGDWTLMFAETPAKCWSSLRRPAHPISKQIREELEGKYRKPVSPFADDGPIDCSAVGRQAPCESARPMPILDWRIMGREGFERKGWYVMGVYESPTTPAPPKKRP